MLSYIIVGSGYRSEYFGRIARTYPGLFRAMFLCRSAEKARLMTEHTGIAATVSREDCLAFRPDFVVVAVDRGHLADVAAEWVREGFSVVVETPAADTVPRLCALWELQQQSGARIVCCEQYHRVPILAAGLREIAQGRIGSPTSAYISLLHDYHAASLIRQAMQISPGEPFTLRGLRQHAALSQTDSRQGAVLTDTAREADRDMLLVSYASGKEVVYDFCPVQYRSFLYSRHLVVRGTRGEWSDTTLSWLDAEEIPHRMQLMADIPARYRCLDQQLLRDRRRNWLYELAPDTVQDEFAIASILLDMQDYLAGGPSPYPLSEALEDAYFWILLNQAVARRGETVVSEKMPWHPGQT